MSWETASVAAKKLNSSSILCARAHDALSPEFRGTPSLGRSSCFRQTEGKTVSLYRESIDETSIAMMRRVLVGECARRGIKPESIEGEDLALVILHAFRGGMTEECELAVLVQHLVDWVFARGAVAATKPGEHAWFARAAKRG